MPIKYVGKRSEFTGNLLFEILNRLKDYGLGRVVVRNSYKRYPEKSFYVIRKVIPMRETIGPGPDELPYGRVWVDEVYRGRKLEGQRLITREWLPDFHLIPKHEEDKYLNFKPQDIVKIVPKYMEPPPVISMLMKLDNPKLKEPKVEVVYNNLSEHLIYKIAEEGEIPNCKIKVEIPEKFKVLYKY